MYLEYWIPVLTAVFFSELDLVDIKFLPTALPMRHVLST